MSVLCRYLTLNVTMYYVTYIPQVCKVQELIGKPGRALRFSVLYASGKKHNRHLKFNLGNENFQEIEESTSNYCKGRPTFVERIQYWFN